MRRRRLKAVICDLDGVLCDLPPYPDPSYEEFDGFVQQGLPRPRLHAIQALKTWAAQGYWIFIFTARRQTLYFATLDWLKENGVPFHILLMRTVPQWHLSAVKLKAQQLAFARGKYMYRPVFEAAFDDEADVLAMYASHGIRRVGFSPFTAEGERG